MAKLKKAQKKTYLLDTSVILDDPHNIRHISQDGENVIVITNIILGELNGKKDQLSDTGYFAREFFRLINGDNGEPVTKPPFGNQAIKGDYYRRMYLKYDDLKLPIYVIYRKDYDEELKLNDDKIGKIAADYGLKLLTNDIAFKVRALAEGVDVESMHRDRVEHPEKLDFFHRIKVPEDYNLGNLTKRKSFEQLPDWSVIELDLTSGSEESGEYETGRKKFGFKIGGRLEEFDPDGIVAETDPYVAPMNLEQKVYYAMLLHPRNHLTVASGSTGSGKTLIALQAGLHLMREGVVDGIVYIRNTVTSSDRESELGYRKGDQGQKLGYFMYPLYSAVNFTIEQSRKGSIKGMTEYGGEVNTVTLQGATETFLRNHNIEVYDIAHARGITISRKFVIFDEVQNASNATVKLMGTRMGKDSRIVFLGDWTQIDHPYLSRHRNGLVSLLQKARKDDFIAAMNLKSTIRSDIARWFGENF